MLTDCHECGGYHVVSNEPGYQMCADCGFKQMIPTLWYVNAYRVTLGYGGPEEGGWWYSIHEPVASVPVTSYEQEQAVTKLLKRQFPNPDNKSSVAPDAHDILVVVEEKVAEYSPQERPQYE